MTPSQRFFAAATCLVAAALPGCGLAAAQTPQQDDQATTTLRIGTQLRILDVTVLDAKGHPVTEGLSKGDFRVFDGKTEHPLVSFDETNVSAGTPTPPRTIILVDHLNSTFFQQAWEQKKIRDYLKKQPAELQLETEILLLTQDGAQMCQGFTRDREELLSSTKLLDGRFPYRITGSWTLENFQLEMGALEEIALQVRALPGRKNLLYLGTGGPGLNMESASSTEQADVSAYMRRSSDNLLDSRVTLFVIAPDLSAGATRSANGGTPDSSGLSNGSTTGGVTQQVEEAISAGDPFTGTITLGLFARTTGGQIYSERNDIDTEFVEAQALGSKYYTLSYKPDTEVEKDGKFIPIKVILNKPGLTVLTRDGYFALAETALVDPEVQARFDIRHAARSSLAFHDLDVLAQGVKRDAASRTVEFDIKLRPSQLTWKKEDDGTYLVNLDVAAVSVNGNKDVQATSARVRAIKSKTLAGSQEKDAKLPVTIAVRVPKSTNHVRIVVRDVGSNHLGTVDIDKKTAEATPEGVLTELPPPTPKDTPAPPADPRTHGRRR